MLWASHYQHNREDYQGYGKQDEEACENDDFVRLPLKLFCQQPLDFGDPDQVLHLLLHYLGLTIGVFGETNIKGDSGEREMVAVGTRLEAVAELLKIPRASTG
jgi:hypothetical protein